MKEEYNEYEDNELFIISDLDDFIEYLRLLVFYSFGKSEAETNLEKTKDIELTEKEKKEMDEVLSKKECLSISKQFIKTRKNIELNKIKYTITQKNFTKLVESLNERLVSNLLRDLVNKDMLESAFDTDSNDFVFWIKEDKSNKNN